MSGKIEVRNVMNKPEQYTEVTENLEGNKRPKLNLKKL